MSGFISLDIKGAEESASALKAAPDKIRDAVGPAMMEGMLPITQDMRSYPDQPPYMGMQNYGAHVVSYSRTGNYGRRVSTPQISGLEGTITSGASYSEYLRGTPDGSYLGAWMHRGVWTPLIEIINNRLPDLIAKVQGAVDGVLGSLGLK